MRLAFLAALFFGLLASAAEAGQRIALIIANPEIARAAPIGDAAGNADSLAGILRDIGFEVTELGAVGRGDMLDAMEAFRAKLTDGSAEFGLFYYAGYAVQSRKESYLLPADFANAGDPRPPAGIPFKGVSAQEFLAGLEGSKGLAVALFDWRTLPRAAWSEPFAGFAPRDGLVTLGMPAGAPIDGDAGNAFAASLLRSLQAPGATLASLIDGVQRGVAAADADVTLALTAPPSGLPALDFGNGEGVATSQPGGQQEETPVGNAGVGNDDRESIGEAGGGQPDGDDEAGSGDLGGSAPDDGEMAGAPPPSGEDGSFLDSLGDLFGSPLQGSGEPRYAPPPRATESGEPPGEAASAGSPPPGDIAGSPPPMEEPAPEPPPPPATPGDESAVVGSAPGDYATAPAPKPEPPVTPTSPSTSEPSGEIAPGGGGGNEYTVLGTMSDDDAWATVAGTRSSYALYMYLFYFENGKHVQEAYALLSQLDPNFVAPASAAGAGTVEVVRHPTMDAPEEVAAGEVFTVSVALTEEQLTPDVTVKPGDGTTVTPEGALALDLPKAEEWPIDIDLLAAGFDLADGSAWSRQITLYRNGDSDFARFDIRARKIRDASKERQLIARLYHQGRFLGSVSRPITVLHEGTAPAEAAASSAPAAEGGGNATAATAAPAGLMMAGAETALTSEISMDDVTSDDAPDLEVTINYADPDNLGDGTIYIHSPHIGPPVVAEFSTPAGMSDWLTSEYARLVSLGLKVRGAQPLNAEPAMDEQSQKRFILRVADGFGRDLYRNYVPDAFKQVFWSLKGQGKLHSIQITSNSPVLPWELVVPESPEGKVGGFLGIDYRMARWAPRADAGQVDRPLNEMAFTGVAAVAPAYDHNAELPFQKVEVDALSKLTGFRLVDGDFSSFEKLVGEVSTGFIHFSGHGEVNDPGSGSPVFAIRLLDQELDPTTWRALSFAPHDKGNPFFFFNACDSGQARSLGGFVQGWGPAVLASGASGFIGGMWPLTDRTAADFSTNFYGDISGRLKDGPVYVAEVLQQVRSRFYQTGDPTYLAYTFYGNANLQVVSQ